jgi:hypothetical protein
MSPSTLLISLAMGMLFGLILQRVQASSPDRIIGTLMLRDLTILKFMVLSVGVGALGIGVLTMLGLAHLKIKALSLLGVGLGGIVFGVGFAIGGYCPGTCLVGAAEGRRDALFTILGGFLGALVYALVFPWSKEWLLTPLDFGKPTLASVTGLGPGLVGILFGALMIVVSLVLPVRPGDKKAPGEHLGIGSGGWA